MAGIQDLIGQAVQGIAANPDMLGKLTSDPMAALGALTGGQQVSEEQASQVVTGVSALASGNDIDFGALAGMASSLLSQSGGDVSALANNLLGTGSTQGASGNQAEMLGNIANLLGSGSIPGVDLSDGFDLNDVKGFINAMTGGK